MRLSVVQAVFGSAALLLSVPPAAGSYSHRHAHLHDLQHHARRHIHAHHPASSDERAHADAHASAPLGRRATCSLPNDPDLVPVPGASNNGFAMSPDQSCTSGSYCPFACRPGKVMAQWQPGSTYVYPQSMNGGLFCDGGTPKKPFPDKPYCVDGTGTVSAVNRCGDTVAFCQTVLPGNEAMLIPTEVTGTSVLAVPGPSYWDGTAAHYYVNPPGVSTADGCVWGDGGRPIGNWSPYVAGANTDASGNTYVKIAWNPIWTASDLAGTTPGFGIKIECDGGGCNGLPCAIDPSVGGAGGVQSPGSTVGVGGASFCVVTVPKGGSANIVVFNTDGSGGSSSPPSSSSPPPPSTSAAPPPSTQQQQHPTTSSPSPSPPPSSASSPAPSSTSVPTTTLVPVPSSSASPTSTLAPLFAGIFHENSTSSSAGGGGGSSYGTTLAPSLSAARTGAPQPTSSKKSEGAVEKGSAAVAGLIVALVAAAALY